MSHPCTNKQPPLPLPHKCWRSFIHTDGATQLLLKEQAKQKSKMTQRRRVMKPFAVRAVHRPQKILALPVEEDTTVNRQKAVVKEATQLSKTQSIQSLVQTVEPLLKESPSLSDIQRIVNQSSISLETLQTSFHLLRDQRMQTLVSLVLFALQSEMVDALMQALHFSQEKYLDLIVYWTRSISYCLDSLLEFVSEEPLLIAIIFEKLPESENYFPRVLKQLIPFIWSSTVLLKRFSELLYKHRFHRNTEWYDAYQLWTRQEPLLERTSLLMECLILPTCIVLCDEEQCNNWIKTVSAADWEKSIQKENVPKSLLYRVFQIYPIRNITLLWPLRDRDWQDCVQKWLERMQDSLSVWLEWDRLVQYLSVQNQISLTDQTHLFHFICISAKKYLPFVSNCHEWIEKSTRNTTLFQLTLILTLGIVQSTENDAYYSLLLEFPVSSVDRALVYLKTLSLVWQEWKKEAETGNGVGKASWMKRWILRVDAVQDARLERMKTELLNDLPLPFSSNENQEKSNISTRDEKLFISHLSSPTFTRSISSFSTSNPIRTAALSTPTHESLGRLEPVIDMSFDDELMNDSISDIISIPTISNSKQSSFHTKSPNHSKQFHSWRDESLQTELPLTKDELLQTEPDWVQNFDSIKLNDESRVSLGQENVHHVLNALPFASSSRHRSSVALHPLLKRLFLLDPSFLVAYCSGPLSPLSVKEQLMPLSALLWDFDAKLPQPLSLAQALLLVQDQIVLKRAGRSQSTRHSFSKTPTKQPSSESPSFQNLYHRDSFLEKSNHTSLPDQSTLSLQEMERKSSFSHSNMSVDEALAQSVSAAVAQQFAVAEAALRIDRVWKDSGICK